MRCDANSRLVPGPENVEAIALLRNPVVTGATVGARNAKQVDGVMHAGELELSHDEIAEIEGAAAVATAR
jgi:aryl-alcohol dehydrogenase-like predicted oxidoreductase